MAAVDPIGTDGQLRVVVVLGHVQGARPAVPVGPGGVVDPGQKKLPTAQQRRFLVFEPVIDGGHADTHAGLLVRVTGQRQSQLLAIPRAQVVGYQAIGVGRRQGSEEQRGVQPVFGSNHPTNN